WQSENVGGLWFRHANSRYATPGGAVPGPPLTSSSAGRMPPGVQNDADVLWAWMRARAPGLDLRSTLLLWAAPKQHTAKRGGATLPEKRTHRHRPNRQRPEAAANSIGEPDPREPRPAHSCSGRQSPPGSCPRPVAPDLPARFWAS